MSTNFFFKCLLTIPSNILPLHLKQTFPPIIWIFVKYEGDRIESRLPKSFLTSNHFNTKYLVFCMHNFLCLWVAFVQRVFFFVVYFNLRPTKKIYFKIKISVKKLTMKHKSFIVTQQLLMGIKTDQFELDGEAATKILYMSRALSNWELWDTPPRGLCIMTLVGKHSIKNALYVWKLESHWIIFLSDFLSDFFFIYLNGCWLLWLAKRESINQITSVRRNNRNM